MTYEEKQEIKQLIAEVLQEYLRDACLRTKPIKLKSKITNGSVCPECGADISEVVAEVSRRKGRKGGKGCSEAKLQAIRANLVKARAKRLGKKEE